MGKKVFIILVLLIIAIQDVFLIPDGIPTPDAPTNTVKVNATATSISAFHIHKWPLYQMSQVSENNSTFVLKNIEFGTTGAKAVKITLNELDERVSGTQILVMIKPFSVGNASITTRISKIDVPQVNKTSGMKEVVLEAETVPHRGVHEVHLVLPPEVYPSQVSSISFVPAAPVPGQWYFITARLNGKAVEVSGVTTVEGRVDMWTFFYGDNQIFRFELVSTDLYKIVVKYSGLVLEVAGESLYDNAQIQSASYKGTNNQHWLVEAIEDGMVKIINRNSYKSFDIYGGYTDNGTPLHQYGYWGGPNQKFFLIPIC